jgi:hypothetical protein
VRRKQTAQRARSTLRKIANSLLSLLCVLFCHVVLSVRLRDCLQDREDVVRQSSIESLREAGLADGELLTGELVNDLANRCKDKKINVRRSALECLAQLFEAHVARYWRRGEGAPMKIFRAIPKRLILASKLDPRTASVSVCLSLLTLEGRAVSDGCFAACCLLLAVAVAVCVLCCVLQCERGRAVRRAHFGV